MEGCWQAHSHAHSQLVFGLDNPTHGPQPTTDHCPPRPCRESGFEAALFAEGFAEMLQQRFGRTLLRALGALEAERAARKAHARDEHKEHKGKDAKDKEAKDDKVRGW